MLSLRPMTVDDLAVVRPWLDLPHVARWWLAETTAETAIDEYRTRVLGQSSATTMLMVTWDDVPIGWCQWYHWEDDPREAAAMGALDGEIGIDYAIGDLAFIGRGVGTALILALVERARQSYPGAGVLADPDAANVASRRALEKNGFELVAVRPVATEPHARPMAIYRLPGLAAAGG